jgi:hypothetical protein
MSSANEIVSTDVNLLPDGYQSHKEKRKKEKVREKNSGIVSDYA